MNRFLAMFLCCIAFVSASVASFAQELASPPPAVEAAKSSPYIP